MDLGSDELAAGKPTVLELAALMLQQISVSNAWSLQMTSCAGMSVCYPGAYADSHF